MSAVTAVWRGSSVETTSLLEAVAHNCGCEFGPMGVRLATCCVHQMLIDDQRALNGLLFAHYLAPGLVREEWAHT